MPVYDHNDIVFRDADRRGAILESLAFLGEVPDIERRLDAELEIARRTDGVRDMADIPVRAAWDGAAGEYLVIVRNAYEPRRLLASLLESLMDEPGEKLKEDVAAAEARVEAYLGRIEERERTDLTGPKKILLPLVRELRETLALAAELDYSQEELERLSEDVEHRLTRPIAEVLEEILTLLA